MIVFVVTFVSPHTLPLGNECAKYEKVVFINTIPLTEERKRMGYDVKSDSIEILSLSDEPERCRDLINTAKTVVFASDRFDLLADRLREDRPVFMLYERIFKKGMIKWLDPRTHRLARFCRQTRNKKVYLLSIGDNSAKDFRRLGFNKNKIYRFGYFPKLAEQSGYADRSEDAVTKVVWVGRMVDFKRPLMALKAFRKMPRDFVLYMMGDGVLLDEARRYAERHGINVHFTGGVTNDAVLAQMRSSDILLSTSDKGEGWGAVINEGMSCGCAIVCSKQIGCAYTLADEECAVLYDNGSVSSLRRALLEARERKTELSQAAVSKIRFQYNERIAAERLIKLFDCIEGAAPMFESGVCSRVYK